jgi:small subunit ribosomal protein S18
MTTFSRSRSMKNNYSTKFKKKKALPIISMYKIDYKNVNLLRRYISVTGRILSATSTKLIAKEHRQLVKSIRRSRHIRLIPYVWLTL